MKKEYIKIGDVCHILHIDRKTLWRWEKKGIIKPFKDASGCRFYTQQQIDELKSLRKPKLVD